MAKRAVLVGCNYPKTRNQLAGCVNDVTNMKKVLLKTYGFKESDIVFMIDTDKKYIRPTGRNIVQQLEMAIKASKDGDVLYFHFSGHGGQIPAESGDQEDDGQDEVIYPTDLNPMTDDSFRVLLANLSPGVSFTFVSDSCNSGGLLDSAELQIGVGDDGRIGDETESISGRRELTEGACEGAKMISTESLLQSLTEVSGHEVTTGTIRATIYELFREDSSPTVKVFIKNLTERLQEGVPEEQWPELYGEVGTAALTSLSNTWEDATINNDEYFAPAFDVKGPLNMSGHANAKPAGETLPPSTAVLVSGCQSDQTSADVPSLNGAYGALSNAVQVTVEKYKGKVTNGNLVNEVRKMLAKNGLSQRPCLYCTDDKVDANFVTAV